MKTSPLIIEAAASCRPPGACSQKTRELHREKTGWPCRSIMVAGQRKKVSYETSLSR